MPGASWAAAWYAAGNVGMRPELWGSGRRRAETGKGAAGAAPFPVFMRSGSARMRRCG